MCGLLYFVYKYYADRYSMHYIYNARKMNSLYGDSNRPRSSDYMAHFKTCVQQVRILLASMFTFCFLQAMFYATKIVDNTRFIPQCCIMAICAFFCAFAIPMLSIYYNRKCRMQVKNKNRVDGTYDEPIVNPQVDLAKAYEPSLTYPYLPKISAPSSTTLFTNELGAAKSTIV